MIAKANRFEEITEILDGNLFIGNTHAAESAEIHVTHGITHIVSVCPEFTTDALRAAYRALSRDEDSTCPALPKHLQIPVDDSEYDDILVHLPKTCQFIEDAMNNGGRVLVHCVMGISRSVSVVAAYLMKSRAMSPTQALEFIKHRRPHIHPNYGFITQLQIFAQSSFEPSPRNPAFCSWKKRQKQDITKYLGYFEDISCLAGGSVGDSRRVAAGSEEGIRGLRGMILLCSNLPKDPDQTDSILSTLGITHLLSLSPSQLSSSILFPDPSQPAVPTPPSCFAIISPHLIHHLHLTTASARDGPDARTALLRQSVEWIRHALMNEEQVDTSKRPLVLVYSTMEARVCDVAGAWLMASEGLSSTQAISVLEDALPLFSATQGITRNLEAFEKFLTGTQSNEPLQPPAPASSGLIVHMHSIARSAMGSKAFELGQVSTTKTKAGALRSRGLAV